MQQHAEIDRIVGVAYEVYAAPVRRYLTGVTRDASAAEDLTHDAFLRLTVEVGAAPPDSDGLALAPSPGYRPQPRRPQDRRPRPGRATPAGRRSRLAPGR